MKKLFLILAAAMMTASVSAQKTTVTANKTWDNWYIGFNAGVATPMNKYEWLDAGAFKGFAPTVGVRVGKNLTTVFGLALDANVFMGSADKSLLNTKTFIDAMNLDLMASFNLMNLFAGYKGEPRAFEISALVGGGWSHFFGVRKMNTLQAKAALDFAFNLGAKKAWQFYIEPAINYNLTNTNEVRFNVNRSGVQLTAGFNYKFSNCNGTHNFKFAELRNQREIDALNNRINDLQAQVVAKNKQVAERDKTIATLQDDLEAAKKVKPTVTIVTKVVNNNVLQPTVIFGQGKSTVDAAQMASVAMVAKYMKNHPESKILIKGYASPEGNPELNQKLSEARANAVKKVLVSRYGIAEGRLTVQGMGATSELFDEIDFNRVATFTDTTK